MAKGSAGSMGQQQAAPMRVSPYGQQLPSRIPPGGQVPFSGQAPPGAPSKGGRSLQQPTGGQMFQRPEFLGGLLRNLPSKVRPQPQQLGVPKQIPTGSAPAPSAQGLGQALRGGTGYTGGVGAPPPGISSVLPQLPQAQAPSAAPPVAAPMPQMPTMAPQAQLPQRVSPNTPQTPGPAGWMNTYQGDTLGYHQLTRIMGGHDPFMSWIGSPEMQQYGGIRQWRPSFGDQDRRAMSWDHASGTYKPIWIPGEPNLS